MKTETIINKQHNANTMKRGSFLLFIVCTLMFSMYLVQAVEIIQEEIFNSTEAICQQLNLTLEVEEVNCSEQIATGTYNDVYKFKDSCGWNGNYYCEVRNEI